MLGSRRSRSLDEPCDISGLERDVLRTGPELLKGAASTTVQEVTLRESFCSGLVPGRIQRLS